jgi:protein subunit release factor A
VATQIRKFEQEAIVDTIINTIETTFKSKRQELTEDDRGYASMLSDANRIKALNKQIEELGDLTKQIANNVSERTEEWNGANSSYHLHLNRYSGVLSLDLANQYKMKQDVTNKVAIALLPKDAIENMDTIIANIAKEFV